MKARVNKNITPPTDTMPKFSPIEYEDTPDSNEDDNEFYSDNDDVTNEAEIPDDD